MHVWRASVRLPDADVARARELFIALTRASRQIPGTLHFDVGQDVTEPTVFFSVEVYRDQEAMKEQEALPELATLMDFLADRAVTPASGTVFDVSEARAWKAEAR